MNAFIILIILLLLFFFFLAIFNEQRVIIDRFHFRVENKRLVTTRNNTKL